MDRLAIEGEEIIQNLQACKLSLNLKELQACNQHVQAWLDRVERDRQYVNLIVFLKRIRKIYQEVFRMYQGKMLSFSLGREENFTRLPERIYISQVS